jgi:SAM-dependent methyltransferase
MMVGLFKLKADLPYLNPATVVIPSLNMATVASTNAPHLQALIDLDLVNLDSATILWPRCRDRSDVAVWQCPHSGVIFLRESTRSYTTGDICSSYNETTRSAALRQCVEDDVRRFNSFRELAGSAKWLDVGTGLGGFLELGRGIWAEAMGVEPQEGLRQSANDAGLVVLASICDAPSNHFDVISLFHVFEHLEDPLALLAEAKRCLKLGGRLIVEVPHARDMLLSFFDNETFKRHTFWSEHLILHTRRSLATFLAAGGFTVDAVAAFQRYPLANHLHWLAKGAAGGHKHWTFLRSLDLEQAYASKLAELDASDTLIAFCTA